MGCLTRIADQSSFVASSLPAQAPKLIIAQAPSYIAVPIASASLIFAVMKVTSLRGAVSTGVMRPTVFKSPILFHPSEAKNENKSRMI